MTNVLTIERWHKKAWCIVAEYTSPRKSELVKRGRAYLDSQRQKKRRYKHRVKWSRRPE